MVSVIQEQMSGNAGASLIIVVVLVQVDDLSPVSSGANWLRAARLSSVKFCFSSCCIALEFLRAAFSSPVALSALRALLASAWLRFLLCSQFPLAPLLPAFQSVLQALLSPFAPCAQHRSPG